MKHGIPHKQTKPTAQAASAHTFNEQTLRQTLGAIAQRSRATGEAIDRALEEGFRQGVTQAMSDGILTRQEEERLRTFRDSLALEDNAADSKTLAALDRASSDRIMMEARLAAISVHDGDQHLQDLSAAIRQAGLDPDETNRLLIQAWEAAVESALEDGLVSLDEDSALAKYSSHFTLTQQDLDGNGAQTSLVQAAVIRDVTQGIVPQRQNITGAVPFNLMKSEQLVWVIQGVDYLETVVRRERQGTSHGLSVRVARGLYYRPSTFRSRPIEWEETIHADTGLLGLTTKHIYFAGNRKKFRVRYDRIVSFDPFDDGFGIMRDAQTANRREQRRRSKLIWRKPTARDVAQPRTCRKPTKGSKTHSGETRVTAQPPSRRGIPEPRHHEGHRQKSSGLHVHQCGSVTLAPEPSGGDAPPDVPRLTLSVEVVNHLDHGLNETVHGQGTIRLKDRNQRDSKIPELRHDRAGFRRVAGQTGETAHQHRVEPALRRPGISPERLKGRESNPRPLVDVPGNVSRTVLLGELLDLILLGSYAALEIRFVRGNPDVPGNSPSLEMINHI